MDIFGANDVLVQSTLTNYLLALSLMVCLRAGVFSFAGIAGYGVGAYVTAITAIQWGWGTVPAILGSMVVGAALCALLSPILRGLSGLAMGMATIALGLIANVAVVNGGSVTGGGEGLFGVPVTVGTVTGSVVVVVVTAALALTQRGRLGRMIEAVRVDNELSLSNGIPVQRVKFAAFVVSGLIGALGGGFAVAFRTIVTPLDLGFGPVVLALTMLIVGGSRSWAGALFGAVFFTWLPTALTAVGQWQAVIYGVVVAAAAIWVPGGVAGVVSDWRRKRAIHGRSRRTTLDGSHQVEATT